MHASPIRETGPVDPAALAVLYRAAFPGEDLLPLVQDLLEHSPIKLHDLIDKRMLQVIELGATSFRPDDSVRRTSALDPAVEALSLGVFDGSALIGHVLFTPGRVEGNGAAVALLGPLAVTPARQRQGIGASLVKAGLERLAQEGVARVLVLGDPAYYGRFGFQPETGVTPPYALPEEWAGAWQGRALGNPARPVRGRLVLPAPWLRPALWAP